MALLDVASVSVMLDDASVNNSCTRQRFLPTSIHTFDVNRQRVVALTLYGVVQVTLYAVFQDLPDIFSLQPSKAHRFDRGLFVTSCLCNLFPVYTRLGRGIPKAQSSIAPKTSTLTRMAQFVESALRELSVSLCRGNNRIVAAYAALNARMSGSALIPGLPVPTTDAGAMDAL